MEPDELAAAKIWDDAMADVIGASRRLPNRMLANVSAKAAKSWKLLKRQPENGAGDGNRTRMGSLEGYSPTFRPHPLKSDTGETIRP
jgi:hypothetical protein